MVPGDPWCHSCPCMPTSCLSHHPAVHYPTAEGSAPARLQLVVRTGPRVPAGVSEVCSSAERDQTPTAAAEGQSACCTCMRGHVLSVSAGEQFIFIFHFEEEMSYKVQGR